MKLLTSLYPVIAPLAFVCMAAGQEKDKTNRDLARLQGTWRVVSSQVRDYKVPEQEVARRKLTVTGNVLIYDYGNEWHERQEGTIKLDPKTKELDWTWTWTWPEYGATILGIYELKGDDLKIGFGNIGSARPRRFEMAETDVVWLLVLKREKSLQRDNRLLGPFLKICRHVDRF
jgi:uncharacterized protein (TIGR03067 family)